MDDQEIPVHTARSRWPSLGRPLWRNHLNDNHHQREQPYQHHQREQSYQRERNGYGRREQVEQGYSKELPKYRNHDFNNYDNQDSPRHWRRTWLTEPKRPSSDEVRLQSELRENFRAREMKQERNRQEPTSAARPNSLQEAILTVRPLRQVRGQLPEMQSRH